MYRCAEMHFMTVLQPCFSFSINVEAHDKTFLLKRSVLQSILL